MKTVRESLPAMSRLGSSPDTGILPMTLESDNKAVNSWLWIAIVPILTMGIFFRFYNIDKKFYWYDEASTSLRASGYTEAEVIESLFDGHEVQNKELQKFQTINAEKHTLDTIKAVAIDEPENPPVFFIMYRLWMKYFGSSVAAVRNLSAFISILVVVCLYWLCIELFQSRTAGLVSILLISLSPFHILYAQEARSYTLWILITLLSSVLLLKVVQVQTKIYWGVYTIVCILGLYSNVLFGLVIISHFTYVIFIEGFRLTKITIGYLISGSIIVLTFVPWALIVWETMSRISENSNWTAEPVGMLSLVKAWMRNFSASFVDFNLGYNSLLNRSSQLIILILGGYSAYFLYRKSPRRVWAFALSLSIVPVMAFLLPDVIWGGQRSTVARFLIPSYLGIHLAALYLVTILLTSVKRWPKRAGLLLVTTLIALGFLSVWSNSQTDGSWHRGFYYVPQIAQIMNQREQPVLFVDTPGSIDEIFTVLPLGHLLKPEARLRLGVTPEQVALNSYSDIYWFRFNPTDSPHQQLKNANCYEIEAIILGVFWQVDSICSNALGSNS